MGLAAFIRYNAFFLSFFRGQGGFLLLIGQTGHAHVMHTYIYIYHGAWAVTYKMQVVYA